MPIALHANRRRVAALCAGALLVGACSDDVRTLPDRVDARTGEPTARPEPSPTPDERSRGCKARPPAPPDELPHYDMSVRVDPAAGVVAGTSRVTFVGDRATRRLVFRLWPNGPRLAAEGAELVVNEAVLVDARGRVRRPDPTTLTFELRRRLPPGEEVTARLRWRLRLPGPIFDRISLDGDAVRLGSFFPILSWEGERGWATDPPTTALGESSTSPTADFEVTIEAPRRLDVIATGAEKRRRRWVATAVRDFAVAVADFDVARRKVRAPDRVDVVVGVAAGVDARPGVFVRAIQSALKDLSRRYGPYPWETFSMAIMPDLERAGIEYPAMVFQGERTLRLATTHEVAHSWFYALVGNNQARDPWLDEGITSWAQARADGTLGYFRDYDVAAEAAGRLGRPMTFWQDHEDVYYDGVYVQGVKALEALGNPRRTDCALRRYVAATAYEVATTDDLIDAFEPAYPRARRVLARFGVRR